MNKAKNRYGEVISYNGQQALRFEREFKHPPEKVWRALIEPSELKGWFPCRIEGERALGASILFVFEGEDTPPSKGTITEFDPPRLLAYTWETELVRWELYPTERGCLLIFTNTLDPQYSMLDSATGWHTCFDVLEMQLYDPDFSAPMAEKSGKDGEPVSWNEEDRMNELRAEYRERLKAHLTPDEQKSQP